jgi:hexulose-6-phosphate isomerase
MDWKGLVVHEIGFMQGRLVDQIDGKIQAFPWEHWRDEFPKARALGLTILEWTLDHERIVANPYMDANGQKEILNLSSLNGVRVQSLTGDCFMQAPFWKFDGSKREMLLNELDLIIAASANLGVRFVVVPLVDAGRLESDAQRDLLITELLRRDTALRAIGTQIIFETDYGPAEYRRFIDRLPAESFNINYDTGNSASLGYNAAEELAAYGHRVVNVHIKDRIRGGTTVPLGTGAADFDSVFASLVKCEYSGDFILQTARATDRNHTEVLANYLRMTRDWIRQYYGS